MWKILGKSLDQSNRRFFQASTSTPRSPWRGGHQQLIFHSPGTMSSEQLDPRACYSGQFLATNAENAVANGIFNTANPANLHGSAFADAFWERGRALWGCFNISRLETALKPKELIACNMHSKAKAGIHHFQASSLEIKLMPRIERASCALFFFSAANQRRAARTE